MPCRALEAFRRSKNAFGGNTRHKIRLNALSGIGGVQTRLGRGYGYDLKVCLNALSGIGGVQTKKAWPQQSKRRCNSS